MPRLFASRKHRHTYTLLMSFSMSTFMSFTLGFLRLGWSWETWRACLLTWPVAFALNYAAVLVISPAMHRLTLWIHPE